MEKSSKIFVAGHRGLVGSSAGAVSLRMNGSMIKGAVAG
jgi:hypothetical protein